MVLFFYIEMSHTQVLKIIQPISIMTSEPMVLLSISFLFLGMGLLIIGINQYLIIRKKKEIGQIKPQHDPMR